MKDYIITITTDFGLDDYFVSVMKGVILNILGKCQIIDITHNVPPQDIKKGYFVLKNSIYYFPKNTLHLVVIDPGVGSKRDILYIETLQYKFVGPDNGIFSFLKEEEIKNIYKITKGENYFLNKDISNTFHGRDIFAPLSAYILKGINIDEIGEKISFKDIKKIKFPSPFIERNIIKGEIIYIDNFGNLYSNISIDFLKKNNIIKENIKKILIKNIQIERIVNFYLEEKENNLVGIFNSSNLLEISIVKGNAKKYLNSKIGDKIELLLK